MNRCSVCDTTEGKFIRDPYRHDVLCFDCFQEIREASGIDHAEHSLVNGRLVKDDYDGFLGMG